MPERGAGPWRRLVRTRAAERGWTLPVDVLDELASHVADVYDVERAAGRSDAEAHAAACRLIDAARFGELTATRRARRPVSRLAARARAGVGRLLLDVGFDVRYALRAIGHQAGVTIALVGILALGIAGAATAFAILHGVMLRPLPYPDADRLVVLRHGRPPDDSRAFAPADWLDYARRGGSLQGLAAYAPWPMNLTGEGGPERLHSVIVSGRFFEVMGVPAALGRTAAVRDDTAAAPTVAVLSDGFWRRRFGADRDVVGRLLRLNGSEASIVGVMPPGFAVPDGRVDVWVPMGLAPDVLADRNGEWVSLIGRLRPGVSAARAASDLEIVARQLAAAYPRPSRDTRLVVRPLLDEVVGRAREAVWLGSLAALLVLGAALASAANLTLTRASVRRDEMAIRSALGAEPARLTRQLLVESALVAAIAALAGGGLSWALLRVFVRVAVDVPRAREIVLDSGALAVGAAAAALGALAIGGAAAWLVLRSSAQPGVHGGPHRITRPAAPQRVLLALQVALAMVLVTGAALVLRSYAATVRVDPGFDTSDTMTLQLTLPRGRYATSASQVRFADAALGAIRALPGVTGAGVVSDLPFVGNATHFPVVREGEGDEAAKMTTVRLADPGFFRVLRVPLAAGRIFDADDRAGHAPIAILNRSAAARYGAGILGRRLHVSGDEPRTIVGIVGDIRHAGLQRDEGPVIYLPYAQKPFEFLNWMGIVARSAGEPPSILALRTAIGSVDPTQPIEAVQPMAAYVAQETAPYRFSALVTGTLAAAALCLALAGISALTAFMVRLQSRELALRMALGAPARALVGTVVRQLAVALAAGTACGAAGSLAAGRLLASVLVPAGSAAGGILWPALAAWALMMLSAALAALAPALRATRLEAQAVLHAD